MESNLRSSSLIPIALNTPAHARRIAALWAHSVRPRTRILLQQDLLEPVGRQEDGMCQHEVIQQGFCIQTQREVRCYTLHLNAAQTFQTGARGLHLWFAACSLKQMSQVEAEGRLHLLQPQSFWFSTCRVSPDRTAASLRLAGGCRDEAASDYTLGRDTQRAERRWRGAAAADGCNLRCWSSTTRLKPVVTFTKIHCCAACVCVRESHAAVGVSSPSPPLCRRLP